MPRRGIVIFIVVSWTIGVGALTYNYIENFHQVSNTGSEASQDTTKITENYIQGIALLSLICLVGFGIPFVKPGMSSRMPAQTYNMNHEKKTKGKRKEAKE